MALRRALLFTCVVCVVGIASRAWVGYAQTTPHAREEVAVFSACRQAPDAAAAVQTQVNAWFDDHRAVRVLQREMFTAPCPGATEFGSVAITIAVHYQR